ncbi:MAG: hypothetical protein RH805_00870, partial [Balneola sp.]
SLENDSGYLLNDHERTTCRLPLKVLVMLRIATQPLTRVCAFKHSSSLRDYFPKFSVLEQWMSIKKAHCANLVPFSHGIGPRCDRNLYGAVSRLWHLQPGQQSWLAYWREKVYVNETTGQKQVSNVIQHWWRNQNRMSCE